MKIKVGNTIYDSKKQPIMVILTDQDKINIQNMLEECTKYCQYDKHSNTIEEIEAFMGVQ